MGRLLRVEMSLVNQLFLGDCRCPVGSRVTFGEASERGHVQNASHWNKKRETKATTRTQKFLAGVCQRPSCAVPDTGWAKTLIGQSALSSCGSRWKRATLAFKRAPREVQRICRQHSALAGGSGTGMGSLCGTRGSRKLGAAGEPFRPEKPLEAQSV